MQNGTLYQETCRFAWGRRPHRGGAAREGEAYSVGVCFNTTLNR